MKFLQNIKSSARPSAVVNDLHGLLAAPIYLLVPTLFKVNGWAGLLLATLSTWLVGAAFNSQQIKSAAFAMGGLHVLYNKASNVIEDTVGPVWKLEEASVSTGGVSDNASYLQPGSQIVTTPSGQMITAYDAPTDYSAPLGLPSPQSTGAVADYYTAGEPAPEKRYSVRSSM